MNSLRRRLLLTGGAIATGSNLPTFAQTATPAEPYADKPAMNSWMEKWMSAANAVADELHLGRFADPMYFLRRQIGWKPNPGQEAYKPVQVPSGFVTDFTSIPRIFWSALRPDGIYTYAAIIHDYIYWEQSVSREEADEIFRFAMEDFNVGTVAKNAIYSGVRLGGSSAWDNNAKLKAAGEKRRLKAFPKAPTVRWSDWKTKPDVFY